MEDNKLLVLCAAPFVLALCVWAFGGLLAFAPRLTPQEKQVVHFYPEDMTLPAMSSTMQIRQDMGSSVRLGPAPVPAAEPSSAPTFAQSRVTMIIISSSARLAVIDGALLREGDSIGSMVVTAIEDARVQVKNYSHEPGDAARESLQWLYLEESP